ncbi:hypothetical protein DFJ73DRAFT_864858 [Zopfochytrium polystomum]|nr:hypothetical protein DFJ73DRAFT_864858 [Zopfochytrium polystomum]
MARVGGAFRTLFDKGCPEIPVALHTKQTTTGQMIGGAVAEEQPPLLRAVGSAEIETGGPEDGVDDHGDGGVDDDDESSREQENYRANTNRSSRRQLLVFSDDDDDDNGNGQRDSEHRSESRDIAEGQAAENVGETTLPSEASSSPSPPPRRGRLSRMKARGARTRLSPKPDSAPDSPAPTNPGSDSEQDPSSSQRPRSRSRSWTPTFTREDDAPRQILVDEKLQRLAREIAEREYGSDFWNQEEDDGPLFSESEDDGFGPESKATVKRDVPDESAHPMEATGGQSSEAREPTTIEITKTKNRNDVDGLKTKRSTKKELFQLKSETERLLRTTYIEPTIKETKNPEFTFQALFKRFGIVTENVSPSVGEDKEANIPSNNDNDNTEPEQRDPENGLMKNAPVQSTATTSLTRQIAVFSSDAALPAALERSLKEGSLQFDPSSDSESDMAIEIVRPTERQAAAFNSGPTAADSSSSAINGRMSRHELNQMLKRLAAEQAEARKKQEDAEMLAKVEARRKAKEEKRQRKLQGRKTGPGEGDEETVDAGGRRLRKLQVDKAESDSENVDCGGSGGLRPAVSRLSPRSPLKELDRETQAIFGLASGDPETNEEMFLDGSPPTPSKSDAEGADEQPEPESAEMLFKEDEHRFPILPSHSLHDEPQSNLGQPRQQEPLAQLSRKGAASRPAKKGDLFYFFKKAETQANTEYTEPVDGFPEAVDADEALSGSFEKSASPSSAKGAVGDKEADSGDDGEQRVLEDSDEDDQDSEADTRSASGSESKDWSAKKSPPPDPQDDALLQMMIEEKRRRKLAKKMRKAAALQSKMLDVEAQEEEDEFMGLGGPEGEDSDDDDSIVLSGDEDQIEDFTDVVELHRKQVAEAEKKAIDTLLNDVTAGGFRKKMAKSAAKGGFDLSDSDDDEDVLKAALKRRQAEARAFRGGRGGDSDTDEDGVDKSQLEKWASNPVTAAFAKCFMPDVDEKLLSSDDEPVTMAEVKASLHRQGSGASMPRRGSATIVNASFKTERAKEYVNQQASNSDEDAAPPKRRRSIKQLSTSDIDEEIDRADTSSKRRKTNVIDSDSDDAKSNVPGMDDVDADLIDRMLSEAGKVDVLSMIRQRPKAVVVPRRNVDDVWSTKYTTRAALPTFTRTASGGIISTSSIRTTTIVSSDQASTSIARGTTFQRWSLSGPVTNSKIPGMPRSASSTNASFGSTGKKFSGFLVGEKAKAAAAVKEEENAAPTVVRRNTSNLVKDAESELGRTKKTAPSAESLRRRDELARFFERTNSFGMKD